MKLSKIIKGFHNSQNGHVFITALIILVLGSAMLAPLLGFIGTGLKTGQAFEEQTDLLYAADAGIEYAYWLIQNQDLDYVKQLETIVNTSLGPKPAFGLPRFYIDVDDDPDTPLVEYNGDPSETEPYPVPGMSNSSISISIQWIAAEKVNEDVYKVISTASYIEDEVISKSTTIEAYIQLNGGSNLNVFNGAMVSAGGISLNKDCVVIDGNVVFGVQPPPDVSITIDGVPVEPVYNPELEIPSAEQNMQFLEPYLAEAKNGGTVTGDVALSGTTNYGPKYIDGNLDIAMNSIITLEGTIYVTGTITAQKDVEIRGEGSIIAEQDIYLQKVANYGNESTSIIMSLYGNIEFKKDANLHALIYAPSGNIEFAKDTIIVGSIICSGEVYQVESDKNLSVTYDPIYNNFFELPGFYLNPPEYLSWLLQ
jgi:hypothetical protein